MTVSYPEPGDLVKTVVDLVTAVNDGGGGIPDLSNYIGDTILLQSNLSGSFRSTDDSADVTVEAGSASVSGTNSASLGSPAGQVFVTAATEVHIVADGGQSRVDFTPADGVVFFSTHSPVIPASPTIQDIVDALVTLGLVTQAP
jgi:hypothetical protein